MALPPLPWTQNKFFSTWINSSNSVSGTYGNVSLRVDGNTQLSNSTISALGVNKNAGATYALDVSGNSYSTNYFMDSAQSITDNGQLICKKYADDNLASQTYVNDNFVSTVGKSKLMQSTIITATANGQYYWNFGDPQLMVFLTNAGPININLPNVTSASNIGATFTVKKNNQQINAIAAAGFTLLNESNQVLSTAIIGFSTVQVVSFTAISTTGSQWCVSYSQGPNFQVVATLTNGQTFVTGAKNFNTNTSFGATYSMTINAHATFNTVLPTTTITSFPNSNQFITRGFADATYASGTGFMDLISNQTAAGIKTFTSPPVMSGASITAASIPTSAVAAGFVDTTTNQSVGGIKTFTSPPVMSGASITAASIPISAVAAGFMDLINNQTAGGIKTFTSPPVMSGASITAASIPTSAVAAGFMDLINNQTAGGIKTFTSPPIMSGASITAGTIPTNAVAAGFMDLTTNQTATGAKTWNANSTFGATYTMTVNSQAVFNTVLPTTSITSFPNSNQFITRGYADATYASGSGFMDLTTNQTAAGIKTFTSNVVINSGFLLPYHPAGTSSLRIGNNTMTGAVGASSLNLVYGNDSLNALTTGNYVIGLGHNQTCASNQNNTTLIGTNSVTTTAKNNTVYFGGNDGAGNYQDIVLAKKNRIYSTQTAVSGTSILLEFESPENVVVDNVAIVGITLPAILAAYNVGTKYTITRSSSSTSGIIIDAGIGYFIQSKSGLNQSIYWSEYSTSIILVCVSTTKWNVVFDDFVGNILTTDSVSNATFYPSFFPANINGGYQNPITSSSLTYNPSNGLFKAITIEATTALKQTGLNGFGGFYPNLAGTWTLAFGDPEIVVFENTPVITAIQLPSVTSANIGAKWTFVQRGDVNRNYNLLTTSPDLIYDFKRQYSTSTFACNGIGSITIAAVITGGGTKAWAVVNRSDEIASAAVSVINANFSLANAANLPIRDSYSIANGATAITITLPQITLNNLGQVIVFRRVATATATCSFVCNGTQFVYDGALNGGAGAQAIMTSTTYTVRFTALVVTGTTYAWFRT